MPFEHILKPISYTVGIIAMFVIPICLYAIKTDYNSQTVCDDAVQQFVDRSRASGYISYGNYNDMVSTITATGNLYDIKIYHQSKICYPGNGTTFDYNYMTYTTEEILEQLFDESGNGQYNMKNGDYLKVSYSLKEATIGAKIYSFFSSHTYKSIRGSYGGYVGAAVEMGNMPEGITG